MLEALVGISRPLSAGPVGRAPTIRLPDMTGVQAGIKNAAVAIKDGKIYVAAGDSFRRYDPATGTTEALNKSWGTITGGTMVALADRLLLLGGFIDGVGSNVVRAFRFPQLAWENEATLTGLGSFFTEMKSVVGGEYVVFSSGRYSGSDNPYFLSYRHTSKGLWGLAEYPNRGPVTNAAVVTDGALVYRLGGVYTKTGRVTHGDIYSWPIGVSSPVPVLVTTAPKPFSDCIAYYVSGKIVILGIYNETTGVYDADRMVYDIATKTWTEFTIPDDPPFWGATACQDGLYLYSFFGSLPPAGPLNIEVHRTKLIADGV